MNQETFDRRLGEAKYALRQTLAVESQEEARRMAERMGTEELFAEVAWVREQRAMLSRRIRTMEAEALTR